MRASLLLFIFALPKTKAIMKQKLLLLPFFTCTLAISTKAQIKEGATWLGGSIGFYQDKFDNPTSQYQKNQSLSITPAVGKAVKENLVAGISLRYIKNTQRSSTPSGNYDHLTTRYYGGGVFIRRYVPVIGRLFIMGDAITSFTLTRQTKEEMYNTTKSNAATKGWNAGISFTPGISYGINKKLQLETGFTSLFGAGYAKSKTTDDSSHEIINESFSAGINLNNQSMFFIGFRLLINDKA